MTIKLNITKPENPYPLSLVAALKSETTKKFKPSTIYKLVDADILPVLQQKSTKFTLSASATLATFKVNGVSHNIDFPFGCSVEVKINMILDSIKFAIVGIPVFGSANTLAPDPLDYATAKPTPEPEAVDAAALMHNQIENEMSGVTEIPKLADAKDFYDQVQGSDSGSRYVFVARKGSHHLAIRLKNKKVSVRMEPYSTSVAKEATVLGLNDNQHYASVHFQAEGALALERYLILMQSVLEGWEVANINEKKIRELGI